MANRHQWGALPFGLVSHRTYIHMYYVCTYVCSKHAYLARCLAREAGMHASEAGDDHKGQSVRRYRRMYVPIRIPTRPGTRPPSATP